MGRLTDDRFLKDGFYQPKSKEEEKEIRSMGNDLTFEKLYKHCSKVEKQKDELQKQVDELKNYAEMLFEENQDHYDKLQNANLYIEKHEPIWKRNTEQSVKDTAKEIYHLIEMFPIPTRQGQQRYATGFEHGLSAIKLKIAERYGVEAQNG